jgi:hypothetical protein
MNGNDSMAMLDKSADRLIGVALWFGTGAQYHNGFARRHDLETVQITVRTNSLIAKNYLFLPQKAQFYKTKDLTPAL